MFEDLIQLPWLPTCVSSKGGVVVGGQTLAHILSSGGMMVGCFRQGRGGGGWKSPYVSSKRETEVVVGGQTLRLVF